MTKDDWNESRKPSSLTFPHVSINYRLTFARLRPNELAKALTMNSMSLRTIEF